METALHLQTVNTQRTFIPNRLNSTQTTPIINSTDSSLESHNLPFIEANTMGVSQSHLMTDCVVPVFSKDNEITISHSAFIDTTWNAANKFFSNETICEPSIRVSHIIKGRTPEAIHKSVNQLLDCDKTIYYERMMFCFEIPTIFEDVSGNRLNLTIGGVRAYNHQNLYAKKSAEKFSLFIGFKNMVCCNMCISTDGYKSEVKVMSIEELFKAAMCLFAQYNIKQHLESLRGLELHFLSEHQFAQFLGRSRMYQCLPYNHKKLLPSMLMTDTQINLVAKAYYNDPDFGISNGETQINMWKIYNLLTGANKSSYIDHFTDRALNATELTFGLSKALSSENQYSWFIQ